MSSTDAAGPGAGTKTGTIPTEVRQQAAEWLVELQADAVSDATRAHWQQWRAAHPDHERAWQRIESFGSRLQSIPLPLAHAALAKAGAPGRRQAIKTLAVLLFAGGVGWTMRETTPWPQWTADARTGLGQRRALTLADGSRVELAADTAIDIRYTDAERLLRLVSGEILVTTAHDVEGRARPFIVETAHGRISALGTRFAVRQIDAAPAADSRVSVFEGAVAIRTARHADLADAERVLRAGQQTRFTHDAIAPAEPADETATAWTRGMIVAQDMPLADFVAELARHSADRLRCDPAVAHLEVTGTYPLAEPDKVLDMLQTTLPIRARRQRRWWGGAEVVLAAR